VTFEMTSYLTGFSTLSVSFKRMIFLEIQQPHCRW